MVRLNLPLGDNFCQYLSRDVTPPRQEGIATGAAASAPVPSADDLDTGETPAPNGAPS